MNDPQSYQPVEATALPELAACRLAEGWRLVVITALQDAGGLELSYVFEKSQQLDCLRLRLPLDRPIVPSITGSYWAAFTYENELQDLFGVTVEGLAVDFKGAFYMKKAPHPFLKAAPEGAPHDAAAAQGGDRG